MSFYRRPASHAVDVASRAGEFMHHDFCPWANRYVYWLKKPIGWLFTAALCSALLGAYVAQQGFAVAAVVLGFIGIGMLWPAIAMRGISANLSWQQRRCSEGDSVETTLEVINRWPWPVWGLVVETDRHAVNDGTDNQESVALACIRPMTKTKFIWDSKPTQRGLYPENPAFLSTGFPFGIWTSRTALAIPKSLVVWPKALDLKDMPQLAGNDRSVIGAWIDRAGYEGDVIGTRPYRDGDPLRFVHWAQSAARDSLIVCERQSIAKRTIVLRIACSKHRPTTVQERETQEWLIRIGASLARTFLSHQWSLVCEIADCELRAEPGKVGLEHIMDRLAKFQWNESHKLRQDHRVKASNKLEVIVATREHWLQTSSTSNGDSLARWVIVDSGRDDSLEFERDRQIWMQIDTSDAVWSQLKDEWERLCHDSCATLFN